MCVFIYIYIYIYTYIYIYMAWDAVKLTPAWKAVITSMGHWLPHVHAGGTPPEGPSGVVTVVTLGGAPSALLGAPSGTCSPA